MVIPLIGTSKGAPIELKMAHWSAAGAREDQIMKIGAHWIEKRFPGQFKITIYPAQVLLSGVASYEGVVKGIADMSIIVPGWTPGRFPKTEVIDLPPGIPLAVDATRVYWDFYKKFLSDEWKEVKILGFYVQAPQSIHHKNKSIKNFEDMKGQKIRVYGVGKEIVTAFGGIPVSMPVPECYEAIRQGIVSGIMIPFVGLKIDRFSDVCFHSTVLDIYASPFFILMNIQKYNSLPSDIRKAFDEELTDYWTRESAKLWDRLEQESYEFMKKKPDHEIITLSPEEKKKWQERAMTINDPWASALEAKGLPGKMLVKEKYRAIQKYVK
jgi:TRAP-type C4-dicarboxylate transport system substrate-binding protein